MQVPEYRAPPEFLAARGLLDTVQLSAEGLTPSATDINVRQKCSVETLLATSYCRRIERMRSSLLCPRRSKLRVYDHWREG